MTKRFALVCCGKQKLAVPAPAKHLYQSTLFKKTRAYAEKHYDGWYILSALHGALSPIQVIEPYDVTLSTAAQQALWHHMTAQDLAQLIPPGSHLDYLGGKNYELVTDHLRGLGYTVGFPLRGLQIGERLHWLKQREAI